MGVVVTYAKQVTASGALRSLAARLGRGWCRWMHSDITWPVNGSYECRKCRRRFPVPWETPELAQTQAVPLTGRPRPALVRAAA